MAFNHKIWSGFILAVPTIFFLALSAFGISDGLFNKSKARNASRFMSSRKKECLNKERKRLALELHDCVGSLLWGAKVNVDFISRNLKMGGKIKQSFCQLVEILDQSLENLRLILYGLSLEAFRHKGLSNSLCKMCAQIDGKGMKVRFQEFGSMFWNDNQALEVYRIVQELVCNSIKHSHATALTVQLQWEPRQLVIKVLDNGTGFKLEKETLGIGWLSIQHRVKKLRATIKLENLSAALGSKISLIVPLRHHASIFAASGNTAVTLELLNVHRN